jgi:SET and MYND domain-containing protein
VFGAENTQALLAEILRFFLLTSKQTCQAKDWKFAHSLECSVFQKLKPQVLPNNARALLRMVLRTWKGKYTPQELGVFTNLETHIQDIQESQAHLDRLNLTSKAVKSYSDTDMTQEAIMAYAARVRLSLDIDVTFRLGIQN